MKRKSERAKKGFNFDAALHELDQLGHDITRNIQPSQQNAQKIHGQIELYGKKSSDFENRELNEKQKSELKGVREKHRGSIKDIRRQLPSLIQAQHRQEETMRVHVEKEKQKKEQAESVIPELFKRLDAAANDYFKATTVTMDEKLQVVKDLGKELQGVLKDLPKSPKRTEYYKKLQSEGARVSEQHQKIFNYVMK